MQSRTRAPGPWKIAIVDKISGTEFELVAPPTQHEPLQWAMPLEVATCPELVDALFIGDACNHHDRLVDALERVLSDLERTSGGRRRASARNARMALAELKRDAEASAKELAARIGHEEARADATAVFRTEEEGGGR